MSDWERQEFKRDFLFFVAVMSIVIALGLTTGSLTGAA